MDPSWEDTDEALAKLAGTTFVEDEKERRAWLAFALGVKARHESEKVQAAQLTDAANAVRRLLIAHGLTDSPSDRVEALTALIRREWTERRAPDRGLASRERQQAIRCARALVRHSEKPPRRPGTTDHKRRILIGLLDTLAAVVKLAATSGFNAAPVIDRLRSGAYSVDDLAELIRALGAIGPGEGAAPPEADYRPLLRIGHLIWGACGRTTRYTLNQHVEPPSLDGALPDFLRALISLARLAMPSDGTLHKHMRALKNM